MPAFARDDILLAGLALLLVLTIAAYVPTTVILYQKNSSTEDDVNALQKQIKILQNAAPVIVQVQDPIVNDDDVDLSVKARTISGFGYNSQNWGAAGTPYARMIQPQDWKAVENVSTVNERSISLAISHGDCINRTSNCGFNQLFVVFGQLIDHDITRVPGAGDTQPRLQIDVSGDPIFDPYTNVSNPVIDVERRAVFWDTSDQKQYNNAITSWIDGSFLYGPDEARALQLRTLRHGTMKYLPHDGGDLLPVNVFDEDTDQRTHETTSAGFVCGDRRCEEQPLLAAVQNLWLRYHNYLAKDIEALHPTWDDEHIYQYARATLIGVLNRIVYEEFLPTMFNEPEPLGPLPVSPMTLTHPPLYLHFSMASWRLGHSMVSESIWLGQQVDDLLNITDVFSLRDRFFNNTIILKYNVEPILLGSIANPAQRLDTCFVDVLQNHLFGNLNMGFLDLLAINIARGREVELPTYNIVRSLFSLSAVTTFADLTGNADAYATQLALDLETVYNQTGTEGLDLFVGLLAEKHHTGGCMGETISIILRHQFELLRNSDPFFYGFEGALDDYQSNIVANTDLKGVFRRVTTIDVDALPANLFLVPI